MTTLNRYATMSPKFLDLITLQVDNPLDVVSLQSERLTALTAILSDHASEEENGTLSLAPRTRTVLMHMALEMSVSIHAASSLLLTWEPPKATSA
jgi:hypothetical protein